MLLDSIFTGDIVTLEPSRPLARQMGVWKGRIVGFDEELNGLGARETHAFENGCIVPGLIDGHTHLASTGLLLQETSVSTDRSIEAVLTRISNALEKQGRSEWLEIWGYDQRNIGRHITMAELDHVAPSTPVLLRHVSSHALVANNAALSLVDNADAREQIKRNDGLVFEKMQDAFRNLVEPYRVSKIERAVKASAKHALSEGITTCIDAGIGRGLCSQSEIDARAYINLEERDELGIRVQLMPCVDYLHSVKAHSDDHAVSVLDLGLLQGFGGDHLWLGPSKMWFDGGMMARSAAFTQPYEGTDTCGDLAEDEGALTQRLIDAHRSGWDIAAHAIGDRAIDSALSAFEEAQRISPDPNRRHRIEHGAVIRPDHIDRLRKLSIAIGTQPCFITYSGDDFQQIMGKTRGRQLYRGKSLIEAGIRLVGSTDRPLPGTPLRGIQTMMDRKSASGNHVAPDEALNITDALKAYTINGAWAARREDQIGSLAAGKYADMTVLSNNILEASAEEVGETEVIATFVEGERRC
ncbi:amidohydrolase [Microbacterium sp. MPKO10]|uniref:amidohydrolase n=1 Tax=Microbacterium sp. MPKO10 TaxID=2989818 RepID=UPI002236B31E|nr:amidohydrolase [Microbacterium sp. MPKO10]MCW4458648.1 amidohydrolase [Microbacterium sp. MPKO10]